MNHQKIIESLTSVHDITLIGLNYRELYNNPNFKHIKSIPYNGREDLMSRVLSQYHTKDIVMEFRMQSFSDESGYFVFNKIFQEKDKDYSVHIQYGWEQPLEHENLTFREMIFKNKNSSGNIDITIHSPIYSKWFNKPVGLFINKNNDTVLLFVWHNKEYYIKLNVLKEILSLYDISNPMDIQLNNTEIELLKMIYI